MAQIDIFNDDAFSGVELTAALDKVEFRPSLLGRLGVFEPVPVRTTTVAVEKRDGKLALVQTSERGSPIAERENEKRDIRDFRTRRLAKGDTIYAHELQNIRQFGSETELQQVMDEVMRRYSGPSGVISDIELTWENMRLGAIQGIVLDADGSTLDNWYTQWGINQASEIDFALTTSTTNVRGKCNEVIRAMKRAAKGAWIDGTTKAHCICGDAFYDALINHAQVRETYTGWAAAAELRESAGVAFEAFSYGGITFHNYQGTDDNSTIAVNTDKAKFFPVNGRGVFQVAFSPAEFMPFVNTPGLPIYGLTIPDKDRQAWVRVEAYSYPLFMCLRPEMLQRAKRA